MTSIFIKLLNLSISAGMLVLLVLVFRLFLKRYSRRAVCLLWIVVALRLIIPFSFESSFSIMPSGDFVSTAVPEEESRTETSDDTVNTSNIEKTSENVGALNNDPIVVEPGTSDSGVVAGVDNNAHLIQATSEYESRNSDPDNSTMVNTLLSIVWLLGVVAILL